MDDVRLTDGKGILTGNLQVDILYVGGRKRDRQQSYCKTSI